MIDDKDFKAAQHFRATESKLVNAYGFYIVLDGMDFEKWREGGKAAQHYADVVVKFGDKRVELTLDEFVERVFGK